MEQIVSKSNNTSKRGTLALQDELAEKNSIGGGGNSGETGCDLVHILDPKINDRLDLMVQISSSKQVGSCPPYSTSSTANTAVPASPKCGNNF